MLDLSYSAIVVPEEGKVAEANVTDYNKKGRSQQQ